MNTRTLQILLFLGALLAALYIFGCDEPAPQETPTVSVVDAQNYEFSGVIEIPSYSTASAQDIEICWDQVNMDIQCHELDTENDIDNIGLIRFPHLSQEEIEEKLSLGTLLASDRNGYVEFNTEDFSGSCVNLSEFSFFGTAFDLTEEYTSEGGTYMLTMTTGIVPGIGVRVLSFLSPENDSTNLSVDLQEGCGVVEVTANLGSGEKTQVPRTGPWNLDWADLEKDGQGREIGSGDIDGVMIGFYAGETIESLESQVLDLLLIPDWVWSDDDVNGNTIEFAADWGGADGGFDAFTEDGVWLLALMCSTCYNPAPLFVSVLEPTDSI